jgi:hypothetical protein
MTSACSGLFHDMFCDSVPSTTVKDPLPVEENACDFDMMLSIITGKPELAIHRAINWEHAARLYRLVDKYQLEGHRYWFSKICGQHASEEPWEALFLACNRSPIDTTIARHAISEGFAMQGNDKKLCDPRYFDRPTTTVRISGYGNKEVSYKEKVLDASNASILLGRKLGPSGYMAYTRTFSGLAATYTTPDWDAMAQRFVRNVDAIEASSTCR